MSTLPSIRSLLNHWSASNRRSPRRRSLDSHPLESRQMLAAVVSATQLDYQDADGDTVSVKFSKPILTSANANNIFKFAGGMVDGTTSATQALVWINLTGIAGAAGTSITTVATRSATNGGDGLATLGYINATGQDLGTVTIDGDLGKIMAGDSDSTTAGIATLNVKSFGTYGTLTGAPDLDSTVVGKLNTFTVKGDFANAKLTAVGGYGTITIGGALIGGDGNNSGSILTSTDLGTIKIAGDIKGGLGVQSGFIRAGKINSLSVGGALLGGTGIASAQIYSSKDIGTVTIGGSVVGKAASSASILLPQGKITSLTISGSILGGTGDYSGNVVASLGLGTLNLKGNLIGGAGLRSGSVQVGEPTNNVIDQLQNLTIGGTIQGGSGVESGGILAEKIGTAKITGNVVGGTGDNSGYVRTYRGGDISNLTIGGSLVGGQGINSGEIRASHDLTSLTINGSVVGGAGGGSGYISTDKYQNIRGDMGTITIKGDVVGSSASGSASIFSYGKLGTLTIGGSLNGGTGQFSGKVVAQDDTTKINITGDVLGKASESGCVEVNGNLGTLTIGGSLRGGDQFAGKFSDGSGMVDVLGELTTATIKGNVVGGSASFGALRETGGVVADRIGTMTIGGSLIAGIDDTMDDFLYNGAVRSANDIGTLTIKGSVIGNTTAEAKILSRGQKTPAGTTDIAIGTLAVTGRVQRALIQAGQDLSSIAGLITNNIRNADAQIGKVTVGGDWISSNLVAGALPGADGRFGTNDDAVISGGMTTKNDAAVSSRIGSITIGGEINGTGTIFEHFGFVAQNVESLKVNGNSVTLASGNSNDNLFVAITSNVRVNEI